MMMSLLCVPPRRVKLKVFHAFKDTADVSFAIFCRPSSSSLHLSSL
jgi:hypothetical protein